MARAIWKIKALQDEDLLEEYYYLSSIEDMFPGEAIKEIIDEWKAFNIKVKVEVESIGVTKND